LFFATSHVSVTETSGDLVILEVLLKNITALFIYM